MSRDCQPAAVAERRRDAWTIHPVRAARTATPSRIQGQMGVEPELEPVPVAVGGGAGSCVVDGAAGAVTVAVAVTVGSVRLGEADAALLARLPAASWAALTHPAASMAAGRIHPLVKDRMSALSVVRAHLFALGRGRPDTSLALILTVLTALVAPACSVSPTLKTMRPGTNSACDPSMTSPRRPRR